MNRNRLISIVAVLFLIVSLLGLLNLSLYRVIAVECTPSTPLLGTLPPPSNVLPPVMPIQNLSHPQRYLTISESYREKRYDGVSIIWVDVYASTEISATSTGGITDYVGKGVTSGFFVGYKPVGEDRIFWGGLQPAFLAVVLSPGESAWWSLYYTDELGVGQTVTLTLEG